MEVKTTQKYNTRNCECCHGEYATGKSYGDYHCVLPNSNVETKGLCAFCNPSNETWFSATKYPNCKLEHGR